MRIVCSEVNVIFETIADALFFYKSDLLDLSITL
jgi:hypothetical protein